MNVASSAQNNAFRIPADIARDLEQYLPTELRKDPAQPLDDSELQTALELQQGNLLADKLTTHKLNSLIDAALERFDALEKDFKNSDPTKIDLPHVFTCLATQESVLNELMLIEAKKKYYQKEFNTKRPLEQPAAAKDGASAFVPAAKVAKVADAALPVNPANNTDPATLKTESEIAKSKKVYRLIQSELEKDALNPSAINCTATCPIDVLNETNILRIKSIRLSDMKFDQSFFLNKGILYYFVTSDNIPNKVQVHIQIEFQQPLNNLKGIAVISKTVSQYKAFVEPTSTDLDKIAPSNKWVRPICSLDDLKKLDFITIKFKFEFLKFFYEEGYNAPASSIPPMEIPIQQVPAIQADITKVTTSIDPKLLLLPPGSMNH